jgi:hypothetical protein
MGPSKLGGAGTLWLLPFVRSQVLLGVGPKYGKLGLGI